MNQPPLPQTFLDGLKQLDVEVKHDGNRWMFYHHGRPLRAIWNHEAADDLKHFHGLDADVELTECVLEAIRHELRAAVKASQ